MTQGLLFPKAEVITQTEGIKYAGSKLKLLGDIIRTAQELPGDSVWDAFSGTTRVSQAFAQNGYRVISSDRSVWSEQFATCYLLNSHRRSYYRDLFQHLNALPPVDGWFSQHYGAETAYGDGGLKRPWQLKNTRKLDAIRSEIDRLHLSPTDKAVALTGLMLALDKVDSTLGHYVSYLRDWSPRSYNDLHLEIPNYTPYDDLHRVERGDVFDLVDKIQADIAYFDPPYGSNNEKMPPSRVRYDAYYHIWTTVCLNDRPELFGKANRRVDSSDSVSASVFEEFRRSPSGRFIAVEAIERLIRAVQCPYIILSYSSGGRATAGELIDLMSSYGRLLRVRKIDYRRNVMADMRWTNEWTKAVSEPNKEFLFVMEKS